MALILNFLLILSTLSCQQNDNKVYSTEEFSISYPSYLELDKTGDEGTVFILKTKKDSENDGFVENINLAAKNANTNNFENFCSKTESEIASVAKIKESKYLNTNNGKCFRLVFELVQNNMNLTFIQHYFLKNDKIYALTFSAESKNFEKYYDEMNETLLSFKLK